MPDLRQRLDEALRAGRHERALELFDRLAKENPEEPRWPHRRGELLLRMNEKGRALESFAQAVDLYAAEGFVAKAAALAKVMLGVAPDRGDVLERIDPAAARELRRRTGAVTRSRAKPPPLPGARSRPQPPPLPVSRPKPPPLPSPSARAKPPPLPGSRP